MSIDKSKVKYYNVFCKKNSYKGVDRKWQRSQVKTKKMAEP